MPASASAANLISPEFDVRAAWVLEGVLLVLPVHVVDLFLPDPRFGLAGRWSAGAGKAAWSNLVALVFVVPASLVPVVTVPVVAVRPVAVRVVVVLWVGVLVRSGVVSDGGSSARGGDWLCWGSGC